LSAIETLKTTYFPILIDKLKIHIAGSGISLEAETERIYKESLVTIETFFGAHERKTVYFDGGEEVLIMTADEILRFVSRYYGL
jgi:pyrroloquinoline quinone (PQQ) biosynthesis protein C